MQTIWLCERGVLGYESLFGTWKQWPNLFVSWIHKHTPDKAQTLTYFCPATLSGLTRRWRAHQYCKLINEYREPGWKIKFVAHSEGTATGLLALQLCGYPRIDELHLICGACNSDCNRNRINEMVRLNRIGHIYIYVAGKDFAMKLEDTYVGSICFGLQCGGTPMGLNGPTEISDAAKAITTRRDWPSFGHSDCWGPHEFNRTMREITLEAP